LQLREGIFIRRNRPRRLRFRSQNLVIRSSQDRSHDQQALAYQHQLSHGSPRRAVINDGSGSGKICRITRSRRRKNLPPCFYRFMYAYPLNPQIRHLSFARNLMAVFTGVGDRSRSELAWNSWAAAISSTGVCDRQLDGTQCPAICENDAFPFDCQLLGRKCHHAVPVLRRSPFAL